MDPVAEIKARLSIEQLVGRYTQLQKKGKNFVGLCPFHHDTHPSFLVSPDKGICYCFPCQKGGDIFSFYQLIENVDFRQALKDLADLTGVVLPEMPQGTLQKDEKERVRDCVKTAAAWYMGQLAASASAQAYLRGRGVTEEEQQRYGLGLAPDSYTATYDYLLKAGFSRTEIITAGFGIQKDLKEERVYDRFRNRLMFPIHDTQGRIIGFGGRTMGKDDAKYINTNDGPLYRKSSVLYGLHTALPAMREAKRAVLVEGYFDVLACHRVGVMEAVATCGTALTEEHVRMLQRAADKVVLCLDQDTAGRDAAERAYKLCSQSGLQVESVVLPAKDPADTVLDDPALLQRLLTNTTPYLAMVFAEVRSSDLTKPDVRHKALSRILSLVRSISTVSERTVAVREAAAAFGTTETALQTDLEHVERTSHVPQKSERQGQEHGVVPFSSAELTLGLFLLYPHCLPLLQEMIEPEEPFASALYNVLKAVEGAPAVLPLEELVLTDAERQRAKILLLFCEESGFHEWNESMAIREIRRNCRVANREVILGRQKDITRRLLDARKNGDAASETELMARYQELLQLARQSR